jgi:hypothetical protein
MATSPDSCAIKLFCKGISREILIFEQISYAELQGCIEAAFKCGKVVGLRDLSKNISYPLSYVASCPLDFRASRGSYEVIATQAEPENETTSNTAALSSSSLPDKIRAIKESVGLYAVDAIQLMKILTISSADDVVISRQEFAQALSNLPSARNGKESMLSLLFNIFSIGAFYAPITEIVNGLSVRPLALLLI